MARDPMPDIIVLLPGICGSVLKKDGKDLWALSGDAALRLLLSLGQNLNDLVLKQDPPDVDDLGDGISPDRLFDDVHLIPYFWKIDGYGKVADVIKATFDVEPGKNYFEFPYDWRRDNRVSARRLAVASRQWLAAWRASSGNAAAKLILIGHSMGGIVSRYFLECHDGWKDAKALITFGTPYRGSLNALDALANGIRKGPVDVSPLVRSLTAAHQLLPIYPCYDPGDGRLVQIDAVADVPNLSQERAAAALAFHKEIEDAVRRHQREDAYVKDGYKIFPIVGVEQPTMQSARRSAGGVEVLPTYDGRDLGGDGTVPRVSATPRELSEQHRDMFAATRHASLQNADAALVQMRNVIRDLYVPLGMFRAPWIPSQVRLGLDLDDVYWHDEPVSIRVLPNGDGAALEAVVVNAGTGAEVGRAPLRPGDGAWQRTEFRPMPAGTYRVTVTGDQRVEPVADVFTVFARRI